MPDVSYVKNSVSAEEFLGTIKASWNKAVESVLETAQTLKRAEEQLPRKEFKALKIQLQQNRVMSGPTITKLLKIASNEVLTAPENVSRLPPSYATLYEMSQHDPSIVAKALEDGLLNPATQKRELIDVLPPRQPKKLKKTQKVDRIAISVRFSAPAGDIPEELLTRLQDTLQEIGEYVDIKASGFEK